MAEAKINPELAEILRFRVPPWFDPVPWFVLERLNQDKLFALAKVQLQLQKSVLLAQQRAINQVMNVLG